MTSRPLCIASVAAGMLLTAPAFAQGPMMGAYWPNDDGRVWHFAQHYQDDGSSIDNQVRLVFDGTTTAPTGITGQYLRDEVLGALAVTPALAAAIPDPFLRQVWLARPDLRARVMQAATEVPCPPNATPGAYGVLLRSARTFVVSPSEIVSWRCDPADTRSWLYLVSNLSIGNTFTLQLVPDLADNIYLHGTIAAHEDVHVPGGDYINCLRVDYVVDYGLSSCTDAVGTPQGTSRAETRGSVDYAANVGPVRSVEEFIPYVEMTGTCAAPGDVGRAFASTSLMLLSPSVAVVPTTWGRLKTVYR